MGLRAHHETDNGRTHLWNDMTGKRLTYAAGVSYSDGTALTPGVSFDRSVTIGDPDLGARYYSDDAETFAYYSDDAITLKYVTEDA